MGTSASSSGPGSGVSLVPPWVGDPEGVILPDPAGENGTEQEAGMGAESKPGDVPIELAPTGRFRGARTNLGSFASSGSSHDMRRGLGHYVERGLGGSRRAAQRMAGTARKAGELYGVLDALSGGPEPAADLGIDPALLAGRPAREIVDHIAVAISPSDGTLDSEASRDSISLALCELIRMEPGADLTALTAEQIELAMELFIGADICRRIDLDVGKAILDRASSPTAAMRRLKQMHRYVNQSVAAAFRRRTADAMGITRQAARRLAAKVIQETFHIFESFLP